MKGFIADALCAGAILLAYFAGRGDWNAWTAVPVMVLGLTSVRLAEKAVEGE